MTQPLPAYSRFEAVTALLTALVGIMALSVAIYYCAPLLFFSIHEGDIWFYLLCFDSLAAALVVSYLLGRKGIYPLRRILQRWIPDAYRPSFRNESIFLAGCLTLFLALFFSSNSLLDNSTGQAVSVDIANIYEIRVDHKSRQNGYFFATVFLPESSTGSIRQARIKISKANFETLTPGQDKFVLSIHPGFWGVPWVADRLPAGYRNPLSQMKSPD